MAAIILLAGIKVSHKDGPQREGIGDRQRGREKERQGKKRCHFCRDSGYPLLEVTFVCTDQQKSFFGEIWILS